MLAAGKTDFGKTNYFCDTCQKTNGPMPKYNEFGEVETDDEANNSIDKDEADRIKKEKVMWKHLKDEEMRDKLYLNLKEKLE